MARMAKRLRFVVPLLAGAALALLPGFCPDPARADASTNDPAALFWNQPASTAKPALQRIAKTGGPAAAAANRYLGYIAAEEDDTAVVDRWWPTYATLQDPAIAEIDWADFYGFTTEYARPDVALRAARAILASKNSTPYLRESATDVMALCLDESGQAAAADAAWKSLGYLHEWRVMGPFDNSALGGFDKAYGPEKGIDLTAAIPGAENLLLHWYPEKLVDRDGTVHIGESLGSGSGSVFYAVSAVEARADNTAAVLHFDVTGASKIYVNGALVSRDPVYRSTNEHGTAPWLVPVKLHRGWNTILVKIADNSSLTADFRMCITDSTGSATLPLASDPGRATNGAVTETAGVPAPTTAVLAALNARIAKDPTDIEARYCLGSALCDSGDFDSGLPVLRAAIELAPRSGWLHWELNLSLESDEQKDAANAERDKALALEDHLVILELAQLSSQDKSLKATDRVAQLRALLSRVNPNAPDVLLALAKGLADAELAAQAPASIKRALAIEPSVSNYDYAISFFDDENQDSLKNETLKAALARFPNSQVFLLQAAKARARAGDSAGAIALLKRAIACNEVPTKVRLQLADLYVELHQNGLASAQLALARTEEPQDSEICAQLADTRVALGDRTTAIALYQEAVRLDPSKVTLRDKLQLVSGARPVSDLVPAADTTALIKNLGKSKPPAGASEVRWLDEARVVVYPDFARILYVHEIISVLDQAAVKKYQRYRLPLSSGTATATVETARIIKANHELVDCKDDADGGEAAFPSLAIGDTIDLVARVEDFPTGGLAGTFFDDWTFPRLKGPLSLSRYVLITPKSMALNVAQHGGVGEPSVKDAGNWRIREWRLSDMSVPATDPLPLPFLDHGPWIDISSVGSWKQVVDWYQTLSQPQCVPDAEVGAKALELTRDARTQQDKIRAIVEYVARKIQYQSSPFRMSAFIPTPGKKVLRESYGDCKDKAALVTAMLNKVGITAHIALVSPREYGVTPYLPGPRFAHAVAVVETDQGPLWVDATADSMAFGSLPRNDQDIPALVIKEGTTDLTRTPIDATDDASVRENYDASIDAAGALSGAFEVTLKANDAWTLRSGLKQIPENVLATVQDQIFATLLTDARVSESSITGMKEIDSPLVLRCSYKVPDYAQKADTLLIARLPWTSRLDSESEMANILVSMPSRKDEIDVAGLHGRKFCRMVLTLPVGYAVKHLSPTATGSAPFGTYRFSYRIESGKLIAEREIVITAMRIAPADIPTFIQFEDAIAKQDKTQIVLEKQ